MFTGIFYNGLTVGSLFLGWGISFLCGAVVALVYRIKNKNFSKNLLVSLVMFPLITQSIVMLVNRGDTATLGVGVAIAGVFGLVRFRSIQGNSREISCVFWAMAIGIATGVGQVWFALLFTGVVSVIFVTFKFIPLLEGKPEKELKITVPEDVEFENEFDKIIKKHTSTMRLIMVKSTRMGSLFEVRYRVILKNENQRKPLLDELRVINANLPISFHDIIEENEQQQRDGL